VTTQPAAPAATPEAAPSALSEATAWVVQVGSFGNPANARTLRDTLRGMGYAAFDETVAGADGKTSTRVKIGPELDRDRLEAVRARLRKELDLDSIVVPHRQGNAE
jgi:DedD protein